jgi:quinol monooxygenase YgiN
VRLRVADRCEWHAAQPRCHYPRQAWFGRRTGAFSWYSSRPAHAEPGNINYDLHRANDDSDVWILYENRKASSDLAAHFELPYMKAFLAVLPEVLEGEMDLRHCSMVTKIAETV